MLKLAVPFAALALAACGPSTPGERPTSPASIVNRSYSADAQPDNAAGNVATPR